VFFRYGGIFEKGSKEYTLDDFYSLQLDKLDRFTCLKESDISIVVGEVESSSDEEDGDGDEDGNDDGDDGDGDDDDDGDDDKKKVNVGDDEETQVNQRNPSRRMIPVERTEERSETQNEEDTSTNAFMGVSMNATRSAEDVMSTPLPGETLANFYARSSE